VERRRGNGKEQRKSLKNEFKKESRKNPYTYRQEEREALARVRVVRGRRVEVKHEQRRQRGRVRDAAQVEQFGERFDGGGAQVDVCASRESDAREVNAGWEGVKQEWSKKWTSKKANGMRNSMCLRFHDTRLQLK
jgi:hypothetical protein